MVNELKKIKIFNVGKNRSSLQRRPEKVLIDAALSIEYRIQTKISDLEVDRKFRKACLRNFETRLFVRKIWTHIGHILVTNV